MDEKKLLYRDIPESFLKIGGVQAVTYFYLLAECCIPSEDKDSADRTIDFSGFEVITEYITRLRKLVKDTFTDSPDISKLEEEALGLREEIKNSATELFAYQDLLSLHEYVLNRIKPVDAPAPKPINDDAKAREILTAIFRSNTNAAINENINSAVAQLPLRMTKARFRDIIGNELKIYADESRTAFDRNMFILKMSAGLSEWPKQHIEEFDCCMRDIDSIDPKSLEMSAKAAIEKRFADCVEKLEDYKSALELAIHTVNHLIVYIKNFEDAPEEGRAFVLNLKYLADEAEGYFVNGVKQELSGNGRELFETTVGVVDAESERLAVNTGKAEKHVEKNIMEYGERVERFLMCNMLISNSHYADLDITEDAMEEKIDISGVEAEVEKFYDLFAEAASKDSRMMVRARMSAVFMNIPVFFSSRNEVMNYVCDAISGCSDPYEKEVSVELALKAMV